MICIYLILVCVVCNKYLEKITQFSSCGTLETSEWHYVGESGVELPSRNSHSMAVLFGESIHSKNYLVIYEGTKTPFPRKLNVFVIVCVLLRSFS